MPTGSPLKDIIWVLVAAFRKRNAAFDSGDFVGLYEVAGAKSAIRGSAKIDHTDDFRYVRIVRWMRCARKRTNERSGFSHIHPSQ